MIWYYLILFFTNLLNGVFSFLPKVTELPFGIDTFMVTIAGQWLALVSDFWPFQPLWNCLLAYIPLQLSLIALKFILGSRMPSATTINF